MNAYSILLAIAMLSATPSQGFAQVALSGWIPGVATNYGGPVNGMDPNTPSYGLSNVSSPVWIPPHRARFVHTLLVLRVQYRMTPCRCCL